MSKQKKLINVKIKSIFDIKKKYIFENKFYKKNTSLNILKEIKKFILKKKKNQNLFYDIKK